MKSVQFVKNKPKTPPTPADGLAFVRMGSNEGYPAPDLPERMKAFYAKYHRRKLRKNEKGAADLVREARESR